MELLKLSHVTLKLAECLRLTHTTSTSVTSHRKGRESSNFFRDSFCFQFFVLTNISRTYLTKSYMKQILCTLRYNSMHVLTVSQTIKKNLTGFSPDRSRQNRRTEEKTLHIGLEVYCTQYNWIYLDISLLDIYLDTYQAAPFYIQQRWIFGFLDKREVSAYWTGGAQFCVGHHSI